MQHHYQYFVEGETEAKMVQVLKTDFRCICAGKVKIHNVVEKPLSRGSFTSLRFNTTAILIFDTDTTDATLLNENITMLNSQPMIKRVLCIPQVQNLEQELMRSCDIHRIKELLSSKADKDFKTDFCKCNGLRGALLKHHFDFSQFWVSTPSEAFSGIPNNISQITILTDRSGKGRSR